ncbi:hypothetical protein VTJ04DRAFT_10950 [Mycothermus thermophilus]
MRYYFCFNKF